MTPWTDLTPWTGSDPMEKSGVGYKPELGECAMGLLYEEESYRVLGANLSTKNAW
jgi:hypothetical protein